MIFCCIFVGFLFLGVIMLIVYVVGIIVYDVCNCEIVVVDIVCMVLVGGVIIEIVFVFGFESWLVGVDMMSFYFVVVL